MHNLVKQNTLLNRRKRKLSEKNGPWDYRNRSIWEKYFPRGQMPNARQKRHQTVSVKLADCQDSCRVFVLTSRSDHVIVYATEKLIMDGGLPNYRPTRLNDSDNFFRPLTKKRRFFHIFIFYLNSPNHTRVYYWVSSWWANRIGLAYLIMYISIYSTNAVDFTLYKIKVLLLLIFVLLVSLLYYDHVKTDITVHFKELILRNATWNNILFLSIYTVERIRLPLSLKSRRTIRIMFS